MGTYVHHLLIPHIASWISPEFAVKVSCIVNKYITNQMKNKFEDIEIKLLEKEGIIK